MPLEQIESESFRYELARILASALFMKAAKLRELLRWLVEHALSGKKAALSQYAIATEALGYPRNYEPRAGGVRIAMRRLREKLAEYYSADGRLNRFRILIDQGQYEPRLVFNHDTVRADVSATSRGLVQSKIAVLVLPFLPVGFRDKEWFCPGLTLSLMRALAASGQARVVPWTTSHWLARKTGDKREHHLATGADVLLEGLVQKIAEDRFRIGVQWIDGPTGLFDSFFDVLGGRADGSAMVNDLAVRLSHRLSVAYDEQNRLQVTIRETSDVAAAKYYLKARDAMLTFTPAGVGKAINLIEHAVRRDPHFASAHALAAEAHLSIADAGVAPATLHAPVARERAERALFLAPELGDALAARGAVELSYDWELQDAEQTLQTACRDTLAEHAPHWPPLLDLARGKQYEAAVGFEKWALLDPGSAAKAGLVCEFWYYARDFKEAIKWGTKALEMDRENFRVGHILADCYMKAGQPEAGLRLGSAICAAAPELAETNLVMVTLLAQAGRRSDALHTLKHWQERNEKRYVYPLLWAVAYSWLGETSLALDAVRQMIIERHTACLFASGAPYFEPLHGLSEFHRMLTDEVSKGRSEAG